MRALAIVVIAVFVSGIGLQSHGEPNKPEPAKDPAGKQFHSQLKEIAAKYRKWGRVDDENTAKWAPLYCRMPFPSVARMSASRQKKTHGQKLYFLFSNDREKYAMIAKKKSVPVGFTIVKEAWHPEKTDLKKMPSVLHDAVTDKTEIEIKSVKGFKTRGRFLPYAKKNGSIYKTGKHAGLFVMTKMKPGTPGTDNGWVYGTLTPDGKTVTAAGKMKSCMACHTKTPHDRLFGLKK